MSQEKELDHHIKVKFHEESNSDSFDALDDV